jgi:V8-like Glu-specific endopeptidase
VSGVGYRLFQSHWLTTVENEMAVDAYGSGSLPLSSPEFQNVDVTVPQHEAEAPESLTGPELPSLTLVVVERPDEVADVPPDAPPSMPSYDRGMNVTPALLPLSPPPRLLLRGHELDPLIIFPPEGRRSYDDRTYPWRCVCSVASGSRGGCGVLIGPRHVLTASHVIDWQANVASVSLVQGGALLGAAGATHFMAYEKISDVTYNNADDDYAVIILNARLGDSFGMFGCKTYDSDWDNETANWMNIAYAPDFTSSTPVFQTGFFLDEDDFDLGGGRMLISKTVDFVKGMSGSVVFGLWSDGPYAVGVASAGSSSVFGNYNAVAAGSNLTRLVNKARADFP